MHRLLTALAVLWLLDSSPAWAQTLRIYQIDVEQADAALVVMPNGKTLLIDSGNNGDGQRIKNAMTRAGVSQIDAFVLSHYHADHYGGIDELVKLGVPVLEGYDRGDKACCLPPSKKNERTFKEYQSAVGDDAHPFRAGDVLDLDPLVTITALASGGDVVGERNPVLGRDENDMSIALLLEFAGFKAFYGGDIHAGTESRIAANHLTTGVDLYKADHHGSNTSSSAVFMADLHPTLIVISNGSDGSYKHPRQVTLNTYARLSPPPTVLQTNKCFEGRLCGNVPDAFIADPQTVDDDGTIEIAVDAPSSSYTATFGTTALTFAVKAPSARPIVVASTVVISSLLPNPVGPDEQNETVTITNKGTAAVSLVGWTLKDRSGATWNLSRSLEPGESRTFRRAGQAMSLNNAGDHIELVDGVGAEHDAFDYPAAREGAVVETRH